MFYTEGKVFIHRMNLFTVSPISVIENAMTKTVHIIIRTVDATIKFVEATVDIPTRSILLKSETYPIQKKFIK